MPGRSEYTMEKLLKELQNNNGFFTRKKTCRYYQDYLYMEGIQFETHTT